MPGKWLIVLIICMSSMAATSQAIQLPAAVDSAFASKYAKAEMVVWKTKYSGYEVEFTISKNMMKSGFTAKGEWLKTETKILLTQLPVAVTDSFKLSRFGKIAVKDVIKTEQNHKPLQYTIVTMKGALNKTSLIFSEEGHLISEKNFL